MCANRLGRASVRRSVLVLSAVLALGAVSAPASADPGFVELGRLPGDLGSRVHAMNDAGETAGESFTGNARHAVKWSRDGRITRLYDFGGGESTVVDMNNSGTVIGSVSQGPEWLPVKWESWGGTVLRTPEGVHSPQVSAISESGVVVGFAMCGKRTCAGKWVGDTFTELERLPDAGVTMAVKINDRGDVAGVATAFGGRHVVRWDSRGHLTDLGTFGGDEVRITGINAFGVVVGSASDRIGQVRPFRGNASGGLDDLGVGSGGSAHALAVNDFGEVVGESLTKQPRWISEGWNADGSFRSLLEAPGDPEDTNGSRAWAISNAGLAVGESRGFPVRWPSDGPPVVLAKQAGSATHVNRSGLTAGIVHEGGFPQAVLWR